MWIEIDTATWNSICEHYPPISQLTIEQIVTGLKILEIVYTFSFKEANFCIQHFWINSCHLETILTHSFLCKRYFLTIFHENQTAFGYDRYYRKATCLTLEVKDEGRPAIINEYTWYSQYLFIKFMMQLCKLSKSTT